MNQRTIAYSVFLALLMVSCDQEQEKDDAALPTGALSQRAFPEGLLNDWGYVTTEIVSGRHRIRSLTNYGASDDDAFYSRFEFQLLAFDSEEAAAAKMEKLDAERESTAVGRDKDYRRFLQEGRTLYVVAATSNYARLEHQPALIAKIEDYLEKSREP